MKHYTLNNYTTWLHRGFRNMQNINIKKVLVIIFIITFLIKVPNSFSVSSEVDLLVKILLKKGIITQEEADEVLKEMEVATKTKEEKEKKEKAPCFVSINSGNLQISGYIQGKYEHFEAPATTDSTSIKSAVISIQGKITDDINYKIESNFAKKDNILNEAWIKFTNIFNMGITIGQMKVPYSEEFIQSSAVIDTIERSLPTLNMSHERDIGLVIDSYLFSQRVYYAAGVFNGTGINTADNNDQKDVVMKLVFSPFISERNSGLTGLKLGVNFMTGEQDKGINDYSRERFGYLLKYEFENFKLQSEYLTERNEYKNPATLDIFENGWYVLATYNFLLPNEMKLQPVIKYEIYDPNDNNVNDIQTITTLGLNWFINKYTKLMLNYRIRNDEAGTNRYNEFLTQLQVKF